MDVLELAKSVAAAPLFEAQPEARFVPTLFQTEQLLLNGSLHSAAGADAIPDRLSKRAASAIALVVHPLFVKICMRIQEPLCWKGGIAVDLFKGRGSSAVCEHSRSILISDGLGKHLRRYYKQSLQDVTSSYIADTQFGERGVDLAVLLISEFRKIVAAKGRTSAVLFFDLVAAFYSVIRALVFDLYVDDRSIATLFLRLGFSPEVYQ